MSHTPEGRERIAAAQRGRVRSPETRQKISESKKGLCGLDRHPNWKGGRTVDSDGYVLIKAHDHPNVNGRGYVREHRLVMEEHLGRYLTSEEVVDHINRDKSDNRIENLRLYASQAEHARSHAGRMDRLPRPIPPRVNDRYHDLVSRDDVIDSVTAAMLWQRENGGMEDQEDVYVGILDTLTGWCHSSHHILSRGPL